MVCDAPYLQNEFGDPQIFNIILSFSTYSEDFKKICTWELLGANVLNSQGCSYFMRKFVPEENSRVCNTTQFYN